MGYSPPKGRSPTCYSPVRHSHEAPKGLTPVRLACLIRAASVRSEPGSNSPLYCVASHSEEQEAHFSYSVLQQFVHPLQTHTLSILTSSLIFPSLLLQKHTPPPASSLQRRYAFQLFKDPILSAPQTSPARGELYIEVVTQNAVCSGGQRGIYFSNSSRVKCRWAIACSKNDLFRLVFISLDFDFKEVCMWKTTAESSCRHG